jgi:hypothetical protein
MDKAKFAELIDGYADAKVSGNQYLIRKAVEDLEPALSLVFDRLSALESESVSDNYAEPTSVLSDEEE